MLWKTVNILTSTEFALALFGALALGAIPGTFTESRELYSHPLFLALLALLALSTFACTARRWRGISRAVLVIHAGVIITLAGCLFRATGCVSTVNVHEGGTVDTAYRWDLKEDASLGMTMGVKRINREFYPIPIKVGVLKSGVKESLHLLKTGESFRLGEYRVRAARLDLAGEVLFFEVFNGERLVGTVDSADNGGLPAGFPYRFRLVAYQNPVVKRAWVDLALLDRGRVLAEGTSEVNSPLQWNGLSFYHTLTAEDDAGRPYAGIQIVRDPGRPVVFAGFAITGVGTLLAFARRFSSGR